MQVFKITFVSNKILTCTPTLDRVLDDEYFYEHFSGFLIYALVKAATYEAAMKLGERIVEEFTAPKVNP